MSRNTRWRSGRNRSLAAVALCASVVLLGWAAGPDLTHRRVVRREVSARKAVVPAGNVVLRRAPPRFPGPDGVESRQIERENRRRGTTAWQIPSNVPDNTISGFADHVYAAVSDKVGLYVTSGSPRFIVEAFRMGYYGGTGARLVWKSKPVPGFVQPACPVRPVTNTVTCADWTRSLTVRVTPRFVPGDYLLKLVASNGGGQSYVPLTIWDPSSHAAYLIKNDVFTWQAWNPYGAYDLYAGPGTCPAAVYPLCTRARVISFDRPYGTNDGAGDFLGNEYPLVRFAEQHSLDVAYATDLTVQQHPDLLLAHRALLSLGHDECWSRGERQAAVNAVAHGVNIAFFAASPMLRHVRTQASSLGPDREEVDYRDASEDPLNRHADPLDVTANTWGSPPTNWSENSFVGASYAGFLAPNAVPADFSVADGTAWIFRHTGLQTGSVVPGLLRSDFDHFDLGTHPRDLQILGHSRIPLDRAQSLIGFQQGVVYSDMTYYTDPTSNAGVLDTGTNNWIPALAPCPGCPAITVQGITGNILRVFGQGPAGLRNPSIRNWQLYY